VDVSRGESVERELDRLITKRAMTPATATPPGAHLRRERAPL
jgi:hypothetical protein